MEHCTRQPGFTEALKGENGHLFAKTLQEEINFELGVTEPAEIEDLNYDSIYEEYVDKRVDVVSKYDSNKIMEGAVGFDLVAERTAQPQKSRDIAHQTYIEKVLADYFVQKRGQYSRSNDLMKKLNEEFDPTKTDSVDKMFRDLTTMTFKRDTNLITTHAYM